jgi:cytochrome c-type biogenesis protein CcmH/NrfG
LCGSELLNEAAELDPVGFDEEVDQIDEPPAAEPSEQDLVCDTCGRTNRPDALFCDQCATPIAGKKTGEATRARRPSAGKAKRTRPDKKKDRSRTAARKKETAQKSRPLDVGKEAKPRVGLLLIGGVVVVAALYGITVLSKSSPQPSTQSQPASQPVTADLDSYLPEDSELAAQAQQLRDAAGAEQDSGRRMALWAQLVELYAANGRLDLAGREQDRVAAQQNSAEEWAFAGNLHFDWMEQQSGTERVKSAQRAVESYRKSLDLDPKNLDVRTDLGVAYLNDPASPMLAIQETNTVLETNPDHIQANFNKGVMLIQIGRTEEAIGLFERVLALAEPGTSAHTRAQEILDQVRSSAG